MTCDEYRARVRTLGLTPCRPSFEGATLHQTADGQFIRVPDPETAEYDDRHGLLDLVVMQVAVMEPHQPS